MNISSKLLSVISFSLLALGVGGVSSCTVDTGTGANPEVKFTATVTDTTTSRTTNAAYQYVTFDIKSDLPVNVKLVLKEKGQTAPTRQEILDGAGIYRRLKTKNRSLFLMYDIDSKIKEYREALKAGGQGRNVFHDDAATNLMVNNTEDDPQNVDALLLKQNTTYTLYAVQSDGPDIVEVQSLTNLKTRAFDGTDSATLPSRRSRSVPDLGIANDIVYYDRRDAAVLLPRAVNLTGIGSIDYSVTYLSGDNIYTTNYTTNLTIYQPNNLGQDCMRFEGKQKIMSFLYPSFSATGNTRCKARYNNVGYQYQYVLLHDPDADFTTKISFDINEYPSAFNLGPKDYKFFFIKDR